MFNYQQFKADLFAWRLSVDQQEGKHVGLRDLQPIVDLHYVTIAKALRGKTVGLETAIKLCRVMDKTLDEYVTD